MTSNPRLSICLPTRNRSRLLMQCLKSIFAQDFEDYEVLVCDDASTDNTASFLESYHKKVRAYRNSTRKGLNDSINELTDMARGQYVMYPQDDNVLEPGILKLAVNALDNFGEAVGFFVPQSTLIDSGGRELYVPKCSGETFLIEGTKFLPNFVPDFSVDIEGLPSKRLNLSFPSAVFRRQMITKVGKFDSDLPVASDLLLESKLCVLTDVVFLDRPLFRYRVHENWGTTQSRHASYWQEFETVLRKLISFASSSGRPFDPDFQALLWKRMARYMVSISGALPRVATNFEGDLGQRTEVLVDMFVKSAKLCPELCLSPFPWASLLISLLTPRTVLRKSAPVLVRLIHSRY